MEATRAARSLRAIAGALLAACAIALCAALPGQAWAAWDGTADTSWYDTDPTASEFTVDSAEDLAGLAKLTNEGKTFEGKTIKLGADIDLSGGNWTPIGNSSNYFKGTFDGGGNTISNMANVSDGSGVWKGGKVLRASTEKKDYCQQRGGCLLQAA